MRNTEQQLLEIHKRSARLKQKKAAQKVALLGSLCVCMCLALIVTIALYMPRLSGDIQASGMGRYGSLILSAPYMGYLVIGVLAFLLGVCAALLCIHLRDGRRGGEER